MGKISLGSRIPDLVLRPSNMTHDVILRRQCEVQLLLVAIKALCLGGRDGGVRSVESRGEN